MAVASAAADQLYQVVHRVRGKFIQKLAQRPANADVVAHANELAEAAWDELCGERSAYNILFACARQLWAKESWAKLRYGSWPVWSAKGKSACFAMADVQTLYTEISNAAMMLPGSEGPKRDAYLKLLGDPNSDIEKRIVEALTLLKSLP